MKTQLQIFYEEQRKIADLNLAFLDIVKEGLTKQDLARLIKYWPERYERFSNWLDKLPEESAQLGASSLEVQ